MSEDTPAVTLMLEDLSVEETIALFAFSILNACDRESRPYSEGFELALDLLKDLNEANCTLDSFIADEEEERSN